MIDYLSPLLNGLLNDRFCGNFGIIVQMRERNFGCPVEGVFRGARDQVDAEVCVTAIFVGGTSVRAQSIVSVENLSVRQGYNQSFQMSYQVEQGCGRERSDSPHAKS
jgi:hypothetical protein